MTPFRKLGENYKEEEKEIEIGGRKVIVKVITYDKGSQRVHCFFSDRNISWLVKRNLELTRKIVEFEKEKELEK